MKFLFGVVVGLLIVPAFAYIYLRLGYAPVATAAPPLPLEKTITRMALDTRVAKEAPTQAPLAAAEPNLMAGAKSYRRFCSECHGLSGKPRSAVAKGMFPKPPQLFDGKGVTDDPVGETYWKVANGIRLTGMPAFVGSLTDEQLWQVSQLLANAKKLPAGVGDLMAKAADAQ
jgi:mono/diheme cytochrome c family protein